MKIKEFAEYIYRNIDGECDGCMFMKENKDGTIECAIGEMSVFVDENGEIQDCECNATVETIAIQIKELEVPKMEYIEDINDK